MFKYLKTLSLFIIFLSTIACASTYHSKAQQAYNAYNEGRYEDAVNLIESAKPPSRDKLLFLLDKGMILHGASKYKESNKALTEAEELSDAFSVKSISRETSATFWSEEATEYAGDKHERILIPVIRMLNYIMLDEWNEALVEVRRLLYLSEKVYGNSSELNNAFALYLSGIIWETLGHINDAHISYKKLNQLNKEVPYYSKDLEFTNSRLGLSTKLRSKENLSWKSTNEYRKHDGQLLVIINAGIAPYYIGENVNTGLFTVRIPTVVSYPQLFKYAKIKIDGGEAGYTYAFYNIFEDIVDALKKRQKRSFVRKMIKLPVQAGLYGASSELTKSKDTESILVGIGLGLLGLSMSAAEKADERSWRTLPAEFQLARFYLPKGEHTIEIIPQGAGKTITRKVNITNKTPEVLLLHFPQSAKIAKDARSIIRREKQKPFLAKQRMLKQEINQEPKNGDLKIDLAISYMEEGNYNVDKLIADGIRQKANKTRAIKTAIIMYTIKGQHRDSIKIINIGLKKEIEDRELIENYKIINEFLIGNTKDAPDTSKLKLTKNKNIFDAFNYFAIALVESKQDKHEDAAYNFMLAHKYGLKGKPVQEKLIESYKKTGKLFRKSKKGAEIAGELADYYLK